MCRIDADDPTGDLGATRLAHHVIGDGAGLRFVGAVRNVVDSPGDDYSWPVPLAHFGIWTSDRAPSITGEWVSLVHDSSLRDRHWFPLAAEELRG